MILLRILALSLGTAITSVCITSVTVRTLLIPRSIKVQIDTVLSHCYRQKLHSIIAVALYQKRPRETARALYAKLVAVCPAVLSVVITRRPDRCAVVTIASARPVMRIVSSAMQEQVSGYVLTDNNKIVADCYFDKAVIERISCLLVPSYAVLEQLEQTVCRGRLYIPEELFVRYSITWYSLHKIVLTFKQVPSLPLGSIITNQALLTSQKRVYAEQLCACANKKQDSIEADIRFGNYIVCAHLRGGVV